VQYRAARPGWLRDRALRAENALRSARLIALSEHAQTGDRQHAMEAGFDDYLPKPPSVQVFLPRWRAQKKAVELEPKPSPHGFQISLSPGTLLTESKI